MDQKGYLNVNLKKVITISHNKVLMIVTSLYSLKELGTNNIIGNS